MWNTYRGVRLRCGLSVDIHLGLRLCRSEGVQVSDLDKGMSFKLHGTEKC